MTATPKAWTPDPDLVDAVSEQFEMAMSAYRANPNLISEHANHEESIRVGGYSNRTLLELVQNAADAMAGIDQDVDGVQGRVEIVLDPDGKTLYCANAGRPFSRTGLTAITHAHLSAKRGDEIGRFGLGFKSVLAVSDRPQVFSRSVSFEFNTQAAREALHDARPSIPRLPVLRTPTVVDAEAEIASDAVLAELAEWATTVVRLPFATKIDHLRTEIEDFKSEFLLFVGAVREVKLRVLGDDEFHTSHTSRDLGEGVLKIERPDGSGEEWVVESRMHRPSNTARSEVGEAVSRDRVKVTVAVPVRLAPAQRRGRFWAYFPLQDLTSASALFNAPWSVNDDRTTLLRNKYNREILQTVSEMFANVLPRLSTSDDPATHLDYLPARGREELSFGDSLLCTHVPRMAHEIALVPDATGTLKHAKELRPLDFLADVSVPDTVHHAWQLSPNTGRDVPHWRCYTTTQRVARLRQLCAVEITPDLMEEESRDMRRALERMPKRGLLSWLKEWAQGDDTQSAADALRFVFKNRGTEGVGQAKVIPTTAGLRGLTDKNAVFLRQEEGIHIEGAIFVEPAFLAESKVEEILRAAGFRALDPIAILNARVDQLSATSGDADLERFWDAVMGVPVPEVIKVLRAHPHAVVKVPTRDGRWAWPEQAMDIPEALSDAYLSVMLDRTRCLPEVAYRLGVIREPVKSFSFENESRWDEYQAWVINRLNERLDPGDRPVTRISLYPKDDSTTPGPVSMLFTLRESEASLRLREEWTRGLLQWGDDPWDCEDLDSGMNHRVPSPIRWAVSEAGILASTSGYRGPGHVVAPSLIQYQGLLPLYAGPRPIAQALKLPDELERVPARVFADALQSTTVPATIQDPVLVQFVLTASRTAYPGSHPPKIPARVGRVVEPRSPKSVFLAVNDDQQEFLRQRQRPFLRTTPAAADELVTTTGCQRFEENFAFSIIVEGEQEREPVLDLFTGLRGTLVADLVTNAAVTRAARITKRVTTADGVEDQAMHWHLDGLDLKVEGELNAAELLRVVNEAFELHLNNNELREVLQAGLDHLLEQQRLEALAANTDAERLDVYFGPDDLREALPKGLWQALAAQRLVDDDTSVAQLYLTVYGSDSIRLLQDLFRQAGFNDVPTTWAGGAAAISWLRRMGFGAEYGGQRTQRQDAEFVVPGATNLNPLHDFQEKLSADLRGVLTRRESDGRALKAMVELPTGAGKTRVATETVLRLFIEGELRAPVLWIAQSQELCEQAVQTWSTVWRGLRDERPLTIGRLWEGNSVHEPDTEFSVIVATDAKLDVILDDLEYSWLWTAPVVIIDEGHVAGDSQRYTRILSKLGVDGRNWARPLVGLSATPFKGRSEDATKRLASRFGNRILRAFETDPYSRLASQGVLARIRHTVLSGVKVELSASERADAEQKRLVSPNVLERIGRDQARMATLVNHIQNLVSEHNDWPVLVFTPSVLSAQILAATLRYQHISAASVSGQTGRQQRRDVIEQFKHNHIQVLANCDLLAQGFDAPGVRALYIARPTFSPNAYIQMAGRGLRGPENGGKDECLIVDLADNFGDFNEFLGYRDYEELWKEQS